MGESRVVMTLNHMGRIKGQVGAKYRSQEAKGTKGRVNKIPGLYRVEPLGGRAVKPWPAELRVEMGMPAYPVPGRD